MGANYAGKYQPLPPRHSVTAGMNFTCAMESGSVFEVAIDYTLRSSYALKGIEPATDDRKPRFILSR